MVRVYTSYGIASAALFVWYLSFRMLKKIRYLAIKQPIRPTLAIRHFRTSRVVALFTLSLSIGGRSVLWRSLVNPTWNRVQEVLPF